MPTVSELIKISKSLIRILIVISYLVACSSENKENKNVFNEQNTRTTYTPVGLVIDGFVNYRAKGQKRDSFHVFVVTLKNNTNETFKMVRYRVRIFIRSGGTQDTEVFSKSYEYSQRLNAGDVIRIPVDDLADFYMGVDLSTNKNNWYHQSYVEDAWIIQE